MRVWYPVLVASPSSLAVDAMLASKVAVLVAHGVAGSEAVAIHSALFASGALPRFFSPCLGWERSSGSCALFDALVCPQGLEAVDTQARDAHTLAFVRDHHRQGKPLLLLGASCALLQRAGIAPELADGRLDPGIVMAEGACKETIEAFLASLPD